MSSSVIVHIVQAYDFVLLLFSGLLACKDRDAARL
jgi:hypothetical protein